MAGQRARYTVAQALQQILQDSESELSDISDHSDADDEDLLPVRDPVSEEEDHVSEGGEEPDEQNASSEDERRNTDHDNDPPPVQDRPRARGRPRGRARGRGRGNRQGVDDGRNAAANVQHIVPAEIYGRNGKVTVLGMIYQSVNIPARIHTDSIPLCNNEKCVNYLHECIFVMYFYALCKYKHLFGMCIEIVAMFGNLCLLVNYCLFICSSWYAQIFNLCGCLTLPRW